MCERGENLLTPRQQQVLRLLAQGFTDKEIAASLGIAVPTVKNHLCAMRRALQVQNRVSLVMVACQAGMLRIEDVTIERVEPGLRWW